MNKALLVIDIQNDYFWDKRKSKFTYSKNIIDNINETINKYKNECDVIYISHLIQNIITNRLLFGFSIEGTKGAELYNELNIVSDLKFNKYLGDAFTTKKFKDYMITNNYQEVLICGIDLCGCVYHTAIGSIKHNFKTKIISNSTGCRYSTNKKEKIINKLTASGVEFI